MTLHTLFSTVSYCSVLWFIICSTARTKTENIGSEQKKNEEKQPIIFYLIAVLSSHFAMYLYFDIQPIFLLFLLNFILASYFSVKITNKADKLEQKRSEFGLHARKLPHLEQLKHKHYT